MQVTKCRLQHYQHTTRHSSRIVMKIPRIGDAGRAMFFQFICFTKNWRIFFTKIYYVKSVKESNYLIKISIIVVFELWSKYLKPKVFDIFTLSEKKRKKKHENEAKTKVTTIIPGISSISKFLHCLASLVLSIGLY